MFKMKTPISLLWLSLSLCLGGLNAQGIAQIDVLHYQANIEPNIGDKSIKGEVSIRFQLLDKAAQTIVLKRGSLQIDQVMINRQVVMHRVEKKRLLITLKPEHITQAEIEVNIQYHGHPKRGIVFFPDSREVTTVFSTSEWLVCKDAIDDKATLDMTIVAPADLQVVSNGQLIAKKELGQQKTAHHWQQKEAVSSYIFGFAMGPFQAAIETHNDISFHYLSKHHDSTALRQIFKETPQMMAFFEEKAGVSYPLPSYTQILMQGNISQEMAGFTVMRGSYGKNVLEKEEAVNLSAHELAHQWWGNQITCVDWRHFWLNEGLAVFMSTAYRESRWGETAYQADIKIYYEAYQKVVNKGKDKALVFPNWNNPTSDDRVLVYYKGAYVFHLLKEELGEEVFWKALRVYTQTYYGKSVETKNLQAIFEQVSQQDLKPFFDEWVYKK